MKSGIAAPPLHDALVERITLHWTDRTVTFELLAFVRRDQSATPHELCFSGVRDFHCPHLSPWGESFYVNSAEGDSGSFMLQMQSGDEIRVLADGFRFTSIAP